MEVQEDMQDAIFTTDDNAKQGRRLSISRLRRSLKRSKKESESQRTSAALLLLQESMALTTDHDEGGVPEAEDASDRILLQKEYSFATSLRGTSARSTRLGSFLSGSKSQTRKGQEWLLVEQQRQHQSDSLSSLKEELERAEDAFRSPSAEVTQAQGQFDSKKLHHIDSNSDVDSIDEEPFEVFEDELTFEALHETSRFSGSLHHHKAGSLDEVHLVETEDHTSITVNTTHRDDTQSGADSDSDGDKITAPVLHLAGAAAERFEAKHKVLLEKEMSLPSSNFFADEDEDEESSRQVDKKELVVETRVSTDAESLSKVTDHFPISDLLNHEEETKAADSTLVKEAMFVASTETTRAFVATTETKQAFEIANTPLSTTAASTVEANLKLNPIVETDNTIASDIKTLSTTAASTVEASHKLNPILETDNNNVSDISASNSTTVDQPNLSPPQPDRSASDEQQLFLTPKTSLPDIAEETSRSLHPHTETDSTTRESGNGSPSQAKTLTGLDSSPRSVMVQNFNDNDQPWQKDSAEFVVEPQQDLPKTKSTENDESFLSDLVHQVSTPQTREKSPVANPFEAEAMDEVSSTSKVDGEQGRRASLEEVVLALSKDMLYSKKEGPRERKVPDRHPSRDLIPKGIVADAVEQLDLVSDSEELQPTSLFSENFHETDKNGGSEQLGQLDLASASEELQPASLFSGTFQEADENRGFQKFDVMVNESNDKELESALLLSRNGGSQKLEQQVDWVSDSEDASLFSGTFQVIEEKEESQKLDIHGMENDSKRVNAMTRNVGFLNTPVGNESQKEPVGRGWVKPLILLLALLLLCGVGAILCPESTGSLTSRLSNIRGVPVVAEIQQPRKRYRRNSRMLVVDRRHNRKPSTPSKASAKKVEL